MQVDIVRILNCPLRKKPVQFLRNEAVPKFI